MSATLRAGVVGVGHLGRHHARLYSALPGVRLAGVVDSDPVRAGEIARAYGGEVFADASALARAVDLASVATPTIAHEQPALTLLEAGVAVLVEKPIAPDREAGRRMVELATRRGVPLMVGHTERFHPAVAALRERVARPRFLEIHRLAPFVPRSLDVDVVLDLMIHDLDLCRLLLGPQQVVLLDASGAAALTRTIDIASVRLRFADGAAANLTASRISNDKVRRIRVFEEGAYHACDTAAGTLTSYRVVLGAGAPEIRAETVGIAAEEPLGRELAAFIAAVAGGTRVPCSGEDGLAALDLALTIRAAVDAARAPRE
ncbi:MAG: Gfo/Idh/MocA family oxidoreductase [Acidobacteria bacterium]|nr:Gfo/Idh/MocA family oxidoreductase [Acidobacteriota bacterium]